MEHNKETYVSVYTATLLKQAGFDWECDKIYYCYHEDNDTWDLESNNKNHLRILELDYCLLAPSLAVVQKWLREVKGYIVLPVFHVVTKNYHCTIYDTGVNMVTDRYPNYEETLEAGIEKALEIILERGE